MKLKIYSIYDEKALIHDKQFFMAHNGQAIRAFEDAAKNSDSYINKHPSDYKLYCLGILDNVSGIIESNAIPEFIISAQEVIGGTGKEPQKVQT